MTELFMSVLVVTINPLIQRVPRVVVVNIEKRPIYVLMLSCVLSRDFAKDKAQDDGDRKNDQRMNVEILQEFHDSLQLLLNSGKVRAALAAEVGRLSTSLKRTLFPTQTFVKFSVEGQS